MWVSVRACMRACIVVHVGSFLSKLSAVSRETLDQSLFGDLLDKLFVDSTFEDQKENGKLLND